MKKNNQKNLHVNRMFKSLIFDLKILGEMKLPKVFLSVLRVNIKNMFLLDHLLTNVQNAIHNMNY